MQRIVSVVLPERPVGRQRWLTRSEAAKMLISAWRFQATQNGKPTGRRTRRHVARFILVALYSGTRAGAVWRDEPKKSIGFGIRHASLGQSRNVG